MRNAFKHLKLVVDLGGAAALVENRFTNHESMVVVVSGGNVDLDLFAQIAQKPA